MMGPLLALVPEGPVLRRWSRQELMQVLLLLLLLLLLLGAGEILLLVNE